MTVSTLTPRVATALVWLHAHGPASYHPLRRWAYALDQLVDATNRPLASDRELTRLDQAVTEAESGLPADAPTVIPSGRDVEAAFRLHMASGCGDCWPPSSGPASAAAAASGPDSGQPSGTAPEASP